MSAELDNCSNRCRETHTHNRRLRCCLLYSRKTLLRTPWVTRAGQISAGITMTWARKARVDDMVVLRIAIEGENFVVG